MISQDIRRKFLKYFKEKGHAIIASSPVVPYDDPTLLFNNAGMNQFKDVFLGKSQRDYRRAASSQKCVRVGGKHNDLENVGHTKRHLTFFEMLGNFSFGDYFKKEAIDFSWEVSTEVFGLDPERIWPTVFETDEEAFELWKRHVPESRISRFGEKDNFWSMGETGPCGPCSELYYDRGVKYGTGKTPSEDIGGERFLEFWNLVFMQYNKEKSGLLNPLPKPSIDTGAGLERVVSLIMDVDSVFETDVLGSLIRQTEAVFKIKYEGSKKESAFKVIADHLRTLAFAISDGVQPSNVDRGYVLRKILRRAVRYGRMLGAESPFLAKILPSLIQTMGDDYPELKQSESRISEILTIEEEAFFKTLKRGGNLLNQIILDAKKDGIIKGDEAFKLKDTYGLPLDEILLIAKDDGLEVDIKRYQVLEDEAREKSRKSSKTVHQNAEESIFESFSHKNGPTQFLGYHQTEIEADVVGLIKDGAFVGELEGEGIVILDKTPFYAEMGGQVGDTGSLKFPVSEFIVEDTKSPFKGITVHIGKIDKGSIRVGDRGFAKIDEIRRKKIEANHTATHLLHWALQKILGEHIKQAGSVVDPDRLRFDFSHHKALTQEEIHQIEDLINQKIRENTSVEWYEIAYDEAMKRPEIKQFFGEKYGSSVRVIDIEESKELCGGTHISNLGKIGLFRISKEGSIAAGVRRIEAVTGEEAEKIHRSQESLIDDLSNKLKTSKEKLLERVLKMIDENKGLASEIKGMKKKEAESFIQSKMTEKETLNGIELLVVKSSFANEDFKSFLDELANRLNGIVVAGNVYENSCFIAVRINAELVKKGFDASRIVKEIAPFIEGSGGGKAAYAQAGGKAPEKMDAALLRAREYVSDYVKSIL